MNALAVAVPPRLIVAPVDYAHPEHHALRYALRLARAHDAAVRVVHVVTLDEVMPAGTETVNGDAEAHQRMQEVLEAFDLQGLDVQVDVLTSMAIAEGLGAYARKYEADLIVMGTHGRRGLKHWVLGSVAEAVMRDAPCPVLLIRHAVAEEAEDALPVRLLVPTDFSEASTEVLGLAHRLARAYGAQIDLVHVIEPLPFPVSLTGIMTVHDLLPNLTQKARDTMHRLVDRHREDGVPVKIHVEDGYPALTILDLAEHTGADLIVIATQGLTPWQRLFVGSVTARIVRLAPCPVLVVPVASPPSKEGKQAPAEAAKA